MFRLCPMSATELSSAGTLREIDLPGQYYCALQSIMMQLSCRTIRSSMTFRKMQDPTEPYTRRDYMTIFDAFLIYKVCVDGYTLHGGRQLQLGTMTNVSVYGAEHSTDATDVHFVVDCDEDRYMAHLISQMSDKEMHILKVHGVPDVDSVSMIGVVVSQCADSKAQHLHLGRGGPQSESKCIFARFSSTVLSKNWKTRFAPICSGAQWARRQWEDFMSVLDGNFANRHPNVDPRLMPFVKNKTCETIRNHQDQYSNAESAFNRVRNNRKELQMTDWHRAESIRAQNCEPLHCSHIRIPIYTIKWYIVNLIQYSEFIKHPDNASLKEHNHSRSWSPWGERRILQHFRTCCGIPLSYDSNNPSTTSISAGWSTAFSVR